MGDGGLGGSLSEEEEDEEETFLGGGVGSLGGVGVLGGVGNFHVKFLNLYPAGFLYPALLFVLFVLSLSIELSLDHVFLEDLPDPLAELTLSLSMW